MPLPDNLRSLHSQEEQLRGKAPELVGQDQNLRLHVAITEQAMNLADLLRQYATDDEDLKVIQILGMRMFNAFGASLKLALSGYVQNSALLMRDILETVFLVDLFNGDRDLIKKWRFADSKTLKKDFSPAAVRKALDTRYGHTTRRREEIYKLFSELAGHPTMKSAWLMRPQKDGDAVIGPFMEKTSLEAVLSEMGAARRAGWSGAGRVLSPRLAGRTWATHGLSGGDAGMVRGLLPSSSGKVGCPLAPLELQCPYNNIGVRSFILYGAPSPLRLESRERDDD